MEIILLLTLLGVKHLGADFLYQPPYMWQNKGTYGHWGGLAHAGLHSVLTIAITMLFIPTWIAVVIGIVEFFIHYHMDWFKIWWNKKKNYLCNEHPEFWVWLGIDQFVHYMTYVGIAAVVLFVLAAA